LFFRLILQARAGITTITQTQVFPGFSAVPSGLGSSRHGVFFPGPWRALPTRDGDFLSKKGPFVFPLPKLFCGVALLLVLAVGCSSGPKLVKVKGQLKKGDQPFVVAKGAVFTMIFTPVDTAEKLPSYSADPPNDDGTFIVGDRGKGIPAGKYRISIMEKIPGAAKIPPDMQKINAMFDGEKSKIVRELKNDEETVNIDVTKPEG
jgi:hypothetical protein